MASIENTRTASSVNILAAIWLVLAPFVLGYAATVGATNDIILGVIVAVLAIIRVASPLENTWISWLNVIAGVWLIISPFILRYTGTQGIWNDVVAGIIVAAMAIWSFLSSSGREGYTIHHAGRHAHA